MTLVKRKICVVTGSRAEYGLLRWVMQGIKDSASLELQVIVTGMHLSPEFGLTISEIESDGFRDYRKVEMLLSSDTPVGLTKSLGLAIIGFADILDDLRPHMLVVLGDRYEILAASSAALLSRIPIAHCHGGELTEGAFDDAIRHSITKMSYLHFVAAEEYRNRVIQLGESPDRVFNVGPLCLSSIQSLTLPSIEELELLLEFSLSKPFLIVTFHPVTLEGQTAVHQLSQLLDALDQLHGFSFIFTLPNSDTYGRGLFKLIHDFCFKRPWAKAFTSLGQNRYYSCLKYCTGVVGNSSSGIIEAPLFNKWSINIGDRQKGRIKPPSVTDCNPDRDSILSAINTNLAHPLSRSHSSDTVIDPINQPATKIVEYLESFSDIDLKKSFCDIHPRL